MPVHDHADHPGHGPYYAFTRKVDDKLAALVKEIDAKIAKLTQEQAQLAAIQKGRPTDVITGAKVHSKWRKGPVGFPG